MPEFAELLGRSADVGRRFSELLKGGRVLLRSGLVSYSRPAENLKYVRRSNQYNPLVAASQHAARLRPDRTALVDELGEISFGELDTQSNALARGLRADSLQPGDTLAVLARDHRWLVLTMLAAGKLGIRLVLLHTNFTSAELDRVCTEVQVDALLYDSEFTAALSQIQTPRRRYLAWIDDEIDVNPLIPTVRALVGAHSQAPLPSPESAGGFVLLTSGTSTGTPRPIPLTRTSRLPTVQFLDRLPLRPGQTVLMSAPLSHPSGFFQFALSLELANTVIAQRAFHPERALRHIETHRANVLVAFPPILEDILRLPNHVRDQYDWSSLEMILLTGSHLRPSLHLDVEEMFGPILYNVYSTTEIAVASIATPEELRRAPGTVGKAPVAARISLFSGDGTRVSGPDTPGRVFVSDGSGFDPVPTGDIGHYDEEGLLHIDGREDDVLSIHGRDVYPLEVENVLVQHPGIRDVAVFGVTDEVIGFYLKALVVKETDAVISAKEVRACAETLLPSFQVPSEVVFVDVLPRTASGQLLRRDLI